MRIVKDCQYIPDDSGMWMEEETKRQIVKNDECQIYKEFSLYSEKQKVSAGFVLKIRKKITYYKTINLIVQLLSPSC